MNTNSPNHRRTELRDFEVVIPTADGLHVAERIPVKVPMEWDPDLQAWLITPEAEDLLESTKARYMGLVMPSELRSLRSQMSLTQSEIGDLLCIGEKTWTRWESGQQRPSQSLNLLLRAVQTGLLSVYDLRRLRMPRIDWSPVLASRGQDFRQSVVAMDTALKESRNQVWPQPFAEAQCAPQAA
jgi:DNA-binding transcriptional regulator YiaG